MVSNRAYRKGKAPQEALAILEQCAGKQFDPDLVEIFKEILPDAIKEIEEFDSTQKEQIQN